MKRVITIIQLSLLFCSITMSPQIKDGLKVPTIIPPSPTVANLMNFEEVPVDHYTGQPDISVPIYTKSLNAELSLPIVLKYSTLGLRLQQNSGWLGTGWSLDAGGVISRTVRGYPDEAIGGFYHNQRGVIHNEDFWEYANLTNTEKNEFIWNMAQNSLDKYDADPDLYQISIPGYSGRFIIVKDNGVFIAKQLDMNHKLNITFSMNSQGIINSFTIIDPNGYKYLFGGITSAIETTNTQTSSVARDFNPDGLVAPVAMDDSPTMNSSWMLTSIKTSNDKDLAIFDYANSTEVYKLPTSYTENTIIEPTPNPYTFWVMAENDSYNYSMLRMNQTWIFREVTTETKKLTKITFRDKTSLQFTLSAEDSHPENDGRYLTEIGMYKRVNGSDVMIRVYTFQQTASNGKLFLDAVKSGREWSNRFTYYEKDNFNIQDEKVDGWGYTSGDYRSDITKGFNYYDFNAFKKGALESIISKGDGVKEFIWEPHTFTFEGDKAISKSDSRAFDKNPYNIKTATPSFNHQFSANQSMNNDMGSPLSISHDQYIQVMKQPLPSDTCCPEIFEVAFYKGSAHSFSIPMNELPLMRYISKGEYTVKVQIKTGENRFGNFYLNGYLSIFYTTLATPQNYQNWLLGGGLRIRSILFRDNDGLLPKRMWNYRYKMMANITLRPTEMAVASSGSVDSKLGNMVREYFSEEERYFYRLGKKVAQSQLVKYKTKTNSPNTQLTRGGYIGYKRVTVSEGTALNSSNILNDPTDNGFIEYIYSSPIDEPSPQSVFEYPYAEGPNTDLMRGLLKEKRTYNKGGIVVEETINTHNRIEVPVSMLYTIKPLPCKWVQFYNLAYNGYFNIQPTIPLMCTSCNTDGECFGVDCFAFSGYGKCGPLAPFQIIGNTISAGRAELTSTIHKQYFTSATPVETRTDYTYNTLNYQPASQTQTFTEGSEIITLKTEYQYPVGGYNTDLFDDNIEEPAITAMANTYNMINAPIVIYSYKNGSLLNTMVNSYKTFGANQILPYKVKTHKGALSSGAPEDRLVYVRYNVIGNVTQVSMADGEPVSYIWGYHDTLPIAKLDAMEYMSIPATAITDVQAASDTGVEYNLNTALDALRNDTALMNAQVTTLIYDTVQGVKKVTDPKGIEANYNYDYLGRLVWVKDADGNLVNEYRYNFKGLF